MERIIVKAMEASVAIDDVINETIGRYTIEEPRWTQMVEACDAYTLSVTALRRLFGKRPLFHVTMVPERPRGARCRESALVASIPDMVLLRRGLRV